MAEVEFKYDVFVSYSSANKEWVRKTFVPILENAGLEVCDYYRDFDVGAPIVMEMERAILESRKTIPVLSPAYLKSGWTEFESLMLQTLDAANRERRLLPVVLESCELPLRISYMNCINFVNPDDIEIEWQRLSRALEVTLIPTTTIRKSSTADWHLAHPYPMPPNFTGRAAEQKMLNDWLADDKDRLFILRALGGFGKSSLSWQWINTHVDPAEWPNVVFWSFYEGDASFENFITSTLKYMKIEVPQGGRPQVDALLKAMQSQKILLVIDGFERILRLYSNMNAPYQENEELNVEDVQLSCVDAHAEWFLKAICVVPSIKSKVLMTTRLTPSILRIRGVLLLGCLEVELSAMQKEDVIEFFHKQNINCTNAEVEEVCVPYGYHPLTLSILAGLVVNSRETPYDIKAVKNIDITNDVIQNRKHILKVSYRTLSAEQKRLLNTISCFRSPTTYSILKEVYGIPARKRQNSKPVLSEGLSNVLKALETYGLLLWDRARNKYDLHPIVRRYVHDQLSSIELNQTHSRLYDYFSKLDKKDSPVTLADLEIVVELYCHLIWMGDYPKAYYIFSNRISGPGYFRFGVNQLLVRLAWMFFEDGDYQRSKINNVANHAWLCNQLAISYCNMGQPYLGEQLFEADISIINKHIVKDFDRKEQLVVPLSNMGIQQIYIGSLAAAVGNLNNVILLSGEVSNRFNELIGLVEISRALSCCGLWNQAENKSEVAQVEFDRLGPKITNYGSVNAVRRAFHYLLKAREADQLSEENVRLAMKFAKKSLSLCEERASTTTNSIEYDFVCSYWLQGAAHRLEAKKSKSDLRNVELYLEEALKRCRAISYILEEGNILLEIARLRYDQTNYQEAKSLAEEALILTGRCGYVLQGADVNLFLAQYALEQEKDKVKAKEYAETALNLAYCDGPPYYYKVAYHEAERMLEKLK